MNDNRLCVYLDDHFALMVAEAALIGRCWSNCRETPLGDFLRHLENEVNAQKAIANDMRHRIGGVPSIQGRFKSGAAWFVEKLGRFKFNDSLLSYSELSRVVELETLAAAAQERIALWDNLEATVHNDSRFDGITFSFFREQSCRHLEELNIRRRFAAVQAFVESGT